MKYSKLERILRSRDFILYVVIVSVLWLTPNTYYVYYSFMSKYADGWRELAAAGVSLLVSSGIMIYTLRGNIKIANYYMWFEISISAYYYIMEIGKWDWGLFPAFSFLFMLPISLKHYTIELDKDVIKAEKNDIIDSGSELYAVKKEAQESVDKITKEYQVLTEKYNDLLSSSKSVPIEKEMNVRDMSEFDLLKRVDNTLPDEFFK